MSSKDKPLILFIIQLPPPVHGVTVMNEILVNSKVLQNVFDIDILPLQFSATFKHMRQFHPSKLLRMLRVAKDLIVRLSKKKPDLVYFTFVTTGLAFYRDLLFIAILKVFRMKRVFHLHGKGISNATPNKLLSRLYLWAFEGAKVIHLSPRLYFDISSYVNKNDCFFLPNGVPDPIRNIRSIIDKRPDNKIPHILFLSNMELSKGPLVLLEALVKLKKKGMPFRAYFAGNWGSDNCSELFYGIMKKNDLRGIVSYLGPIYGEEKSLLFSKANIFAFPTYYDYEAFPLVLLEAMSYGLPVISTFEGAIPDIVQDGVTGFLVPQRDSNALAKRLSVLLQNRQLCIRYGQAGRARFLDNFTKDVFENNLLCILNALLGKTKMQFKYYK